VGREATARECVRNAKGCERGSGGNDRGVAVETLTEWCAYATENGCELYNNNNNNKKVSRVGVGHPTYPGKGG